MGAKYGAEEHEDGIVGGFIGHALAVDDFYKLAIGGDLLERKMHRRHLLEPDGIGKDR